MTLSAFLAPISSWRSRLVRDLEGDVLEIGAGTGLNFEHYRRARMVSAIEPDPDRAQEAAEAAAIAETINGIPFSVDVAPAEALPYPAHCFDVVVSSLVFCSVDDPHTALAEIDRVLRPGGVLWMVEHVRPQTPLLARLADVVTPLWQRVAHNCHLNRPTLAFLHDAGWQVAIQRRRGIFLKLRATR